MLFQFAELIAAFELFAVSSVVPARFFENGGGSNVNIATDEKHDLRTDSCLTDIENPGEAKISKLSTVSNCFVATSCIVI